MADPQMVQLLYGLFYTASLTLLHEQWHTLRQLGWCISCMGIKNSRRCSHICMHVTRWMWSVRPQPYCSPWHVAGQGAESRTCGLIAPPAGFFSSGFIAGNRSTCISTALPLTSAIYLTQLNF